jgi:ribonuclease J
MSTGSQGEPMSALGRMANRDHRHIVIEPGDTVVLASSLVPGNETAVYRVINGLARWGATVVHKDVAKVHVSGHAPAGELLYLLNAVKPSNLMPVHGEWRHLRAHARLGELTGVAPDRIVLAEDGDVVDLVDGRAKVTGHVGSRNVYVDGLAVGDVGEASLTERRILGDEGFIAVTVVVDEVTGKVVGGPFVSGKGFSDEPAYDDVVPIITAALDRAAADLRRTLEDRGVTVVRIEVGLAAGSGGGAAADRGDDLSHSARGSGASRGSAGADGATDSIDDDLTTAPAVRLPAGSLVDVHA